MTGKQIGAIAGAMGAALIAVLALIGTSYTGPDVAHAQTVVDMDFDPEITGNTAQVLGNGWPVDICHEITADTSGILGSGTHMSRNYSQSERDADGDGIENDLDPCRYVFNAVWTPRYGGLPPYPGDADGDHLPNVCDPKFTLSPSRSTSSPTEATSR